MPIRPPTLQIKPAGRVHAPVKRKKYKSVIYGAKWRKARERFLSCYPLCAECKKHGETVEASVVDHVKPHRGDVKLFWDVNNWQALCKACHDKKTARGE